MSFFHLSMWANEQSRMNTSFFVHLSMFCVSDGKGSNKHIFERRTNHE
nr:MAG TPA: hypothetical protein [Caudoviricetes sp.]